MLKLLSENAKMDLTVKFKNVVSSQLEGVTQVKIDAVDYTSNVVSTFGTHLDLERLLILYDAS